MSDRAARPKRVQKPTPKGLEWQLEHTAFSQLSRNNRDVGRLLQNDNLSIEQLTSCMSSLKKDMDSLYAKFVDIRSVDPQYVMPRHCDDSLKRASVLVSEIESLLPPHVSEHLQTHQSFDAEVGRGEPALTFEDASRYSMGCKLALSKLIQSCESAEAEIRSGLFSGAVSLTLPSLRQHEHTLREEMSKSREGIDSDERARCERALARSADICEQFSRVFTSQRPVHRPDVSEFSSLALDSRGLGLQVKMEDSSLLAAAFEADLDKTPTLVPVPAPLHVGLVPTSKPESSLKEVKLIHSRPSSLPPIAPPALPPTLRGKASSCLDVRSRLSSLPARIGPHSARSSVGSFSSSSRQVSVSSKLGADDGEELVSASQAGNIADDKAAAVRLALAKHQVQTAMFLGKENLRLQEMTWDVETSDEIRHIEREMEKEQLQTSLESIQDSKAKELNRTVQEIQEREEKEQKELESKRKKFLEELEEQERDRKRKLEEAEMQRKREREEEEHRLQVQMRRREEEFLKQQEETKQFLKKQREEELRIRQQEILRQEEEARRNLQEVRKQREIERLQKEREERRREATLRTNLEVMEEIANCERKQLIVNAIAPEESEADSLLRSLRQVTPTDLLGRASYLDQENPSSRIIITDPAEIGDPKTRQ